MNDTLQAYSPLEIAEQAGELSSKRKAIADSAVRHMAHLPLLKEKQEYVIQGYKDDFGKYADTSLSPAVQQEKWEHQSMRLKLLDKLDIQVSNVETMLAANEVELAVNEATSIEHYTGHTASYVTAATALATLDGITIKSI